MPGRTGGNRFAVTVAAIGGAAQKIRRCYPARMSESAKALFLSYASQDADAAERGGLEVGAWQVAWTEGQTLEPAAAVAMPLEPVPSASS